MKKRPIENKGILSVFCTFMKRLVSYITWALNYLMDLLSYHYRMLPVLYEALLSVIVTAAPLARWDKAKYLQRLYINWAWVLSQVKTSLQQIY